MALFGKKKTQTAPQQAVKEPKEEKKAAKPLPQVKATVQNAEPAKKAAPAKAPAKKATENQRKPMSKPASAKPAVTTTSVKVKAVKPAAKTAKTANVKSASKPATRVVNSRPFFVTTEEDVREAFNQAIAEAEIEIAKNGQNSICDTVSALKYS